MRDLPPLNSEIGLCSHHIHCARDITEKPLWRQLTLLNHTGVIFLGPGPSKEPYPRTPASNQVRRMTRSPIFSTTDPSRTSFLRFPPEIRIRIYRLLLQCDENIQFYLCPIYLRLIYRQSHRGNWIRKQVRHGLFPSILECCKTIYGEGSPVLYGENQFNVEGQSLSKMPLKQTWPMRPHNLHEITALYVSHSLSYDDHCNATIFPQLQKLPNLKRIKISLSDPFPNQLRDFLIEATLYLARIRQVTLGINICHTTTDLFRQSYDQVDINDYKLLCVAGYKPAILKGTQTWPTRRVSWEFKMCTDELSLSYGCVGYLSIRLTREGPMAIHHDRALLNDNLVC